MVKRMPTYPQNSIRLMIEDSAKALLLTIRDKINDVYKTLGRGYSESVYQRALSVEFQMANLRHDMEVTMSVPYKGHVVGHVRSDIILRTSPSVILETKATGTSLKPEERWQLSRYLKLQDVSLGVLVNFPQTGAAGPMIEFFVYSDNEFYAYNVDTGYAVLVA